MSKGSRLAIQLLRVAYAKDQAQFIPYVDGMTRPEGYGHWTLSTNHLDPKSPEPQLWCTWESEYNYSGYYHVAGLQIGC